MKIRKGTRLMVKRGPDGHIPSESAYVDDIVVEIDEKDKIWVRVLLTIRDDGSRPDQQFWVPIFMLKRWADWA